MAGEPRGKRGLAGNRLILILALWLVLVVVGGLLIYYGWFAGRGDDEAALSTATAPLATATSAAVAVRPTATVAAQPESTEPPAPEMSEEVFGYGIAINGTGGGPVEFMMGQVESLGLGWVKQQVKWSSFEGSPGTMDWSGFDVVVEEAGKKNIKVLFSVVDAPTWARTYQDDNTQGAPPDDFAVFVDFLTRLLDRYQGRIHAIEVWNEQNLDREWDTAEGVSPERYVEMLRLAYETIKNRDPNIIVISGAPSNLGFTASDPNNESRLVVMDDFEYVERMIAAGALDYCDCVGAHHNGFNMPPNVAWDEGYNDPAATFRGPFDNPDHSWSFKSTLWGYHERIAAAGRDTPLCLTEFGWASAEGFEGYPPGFEFALDNTLQEQAEWDVQAFQLMREWGFVRMAMLWNLNYSQLGWGPEDPNAPYALVDFNGVARPAYGAVGAMAKP
ncbi:MAG: cellulase family glycosylhydrolase [Anaerolineales bacterium]|nr:cellulase family glycosylhydrolase [Anaerolineales bacterium]